VEKIFVGCACGGGSRAFLGYSLVPSRELDRLVCANSFLIPYRENRTNENNVRITVFSGVGRVNVSDVATESGVAADLDEQVLLRGAASVDPWALAPI